ncbi:MAG: restriction endonuclease subunit S [Bacteroidia bacterium]|nr:restriction endonuclease subunit S [Bacteroidia bacterium]
MQLTAKSSVDSVRREMISKMLIPLPPLPEQTAIATALKDTEDLINSLEKMIAKKKLIKQGAMQELLKPKAGWVVKNISEVGEVKRGASSQQIKYLKSDGVRLIRINDFFDNNPVFVQPTADIMRYKINEYDILFAGTGNSAGASYIAPNEWIGLPHSYNAPRIRINKNENRTYIYYCLQSHHILLQQKEKFVGAAQPFLDTSAIANFKILYPNSTEQNAIATTLVEMDSEINSFEIKLQKCKIFKEGKMQQLLTGKIRLI